MHLLVITQKVDQFDHLLAFFHTWILQFAKHVSSFDVIALSVGSYDLPPHVRVYSLGKEKGTNKVLQAFRFYYYLFRTLPKADGVFVHMAPEYVRALYPLNIFFRKPVFMWYAHIKVSPVAKWAMNHVQKIFTPSKESFAINSSKVISTGHGIDTRVFAPRDPKKKNEIPIVLAESRISRVKRLHVLIEALSELRNSNPNQDFKCRIVGGTVYSDDEAYLNELKSLVAQKRLTDKVEWVGWVPNKNMPTFYNEANVFVRLQGGGGYGKTELEAMACGTPVVLCTPVYNSYFSGFIDDMYFPEDDSSRCASNISRVFNWTDSRAKEYSNLARTLVVTNHNIERLAERIVLEFKKPA